MTWIFFWGWITFWGYIRSGDLSVSAVFYTNGSHWGRWNMRHTKGSSTLANDPKLCVVLFYLWLGTAKRNQKHQKNRFRNHIGFYKLTWWCFPMAALISPWLRLIQKSLDRHIVWPDNGRMIPWPSSSEWPLPITAWHTALAAAAPISSGVLDVEVCGPGKTDKRTMSVALFFGRIWVKGEGVRKSGKRFSQGFGEMEKEEVRENDVLKFFLIFSVVYSLSSSI